MAKWAEMMVFQEVPTGFAMDTGNGHDVALSAAPTAQQEWDAETVQIAAEGHKDDGAKARYDLIPPELLEATAQVLTFGATKYGQRNWEKGMAWGRPFAALMRHMWAWWRGEKADPETGMSHLWHASCCIAFLVAFEARDVGNDDRPVEDK